MNTQKAILIAEPAEALSGNLGAFLRDKGFALLKTGNLKETLLTLQGQRVDALVLHATLLEEDCDLGCEIESYLTMDPSLDGVVTAQDPAAGVWVALDSVVWIEHGLYVIRVPVVVGMTEEDATQLLHGAGYHYVEVTYVTTLTPSKMGKVIEQDPDPGVLLEPWRTVQLKVGATTPPMSM